MPSLTYLDYEYHILPKNNNVYPVQVKVGGQMDYSGVIGPDIVSIKPSSDPKADGQALFGFMFADAELKRSWDEARGKLIYRRIRLWIDTYVPELHALPWESLHDGRTWITADGKTPFSRYMAVDTPWGESVANNPLRILVVVSSPEDSWKHHLAELDAEEEYERVNSSLKQNLGQAMVVNHLDAPVTLENIERELSKGYHILHFIGHGQYIIPKSKAQLYLQNDEGNTHLVDDEKIAGSLRRLKHPPQLVMLAACRSAVQGTNDAFDGLAAKLVATGMPAVIAMKDRVRITSAQKLISRFYESLCRDGEVDCALSEARSALLTTDCKDASVPALYMRMVDGRLFEPVTSNTHTYQSVSVNKPKPLNPFTDVVAVTDPKRFIGREADLRRIRMQLQNGSVALVGPRKIGKTSVMHHLANTLQKEPNHTVIKWDFFDMGSVEDFISYALMQLGEVGTSWYDFKRVLRGKKVFLMLDELELAPLRGFDVDWLRGCRALVQSGHKLHFVTASNAMPKIVFPTKDGSWPYDFLTPYKVRPFREKEARRLLEHPWDVLAPQFDATAIVAILELAGYHPYRLQRAAYRYYEYMLDNDYDWREAYELDMEALI